MSGVTTPPIVLRPFAAQAAPEYITLPIPDASQIDVTPGKASFATGFPPLNMTNPTLGGIPPSGADMNGILYTVSAWCAALQAGQFSKYDAAAAVAFDGYKAGALLTKADNSGFWFNLVDGNQSNPDEGGTGWVGFQPAGTGYLTSVPPDGTTNNYLPPGFNSSIGVLDLNPNDGDATITGLIAGADSQRVIISNVHASNKVVLAAMSGSSDAANRFRLPANMTLLQNMSITLQYSTGAGVWLSAV